MLYGQCGIDEDIYQLRIQNIQSFGIEQKIEVEFILHPLYMTNLKVIYHISEVRNLKMGYMLPKFHIIYDEMFHTIPNLKHVLPVDNTVLT